MADIVGSIQILTCLQEYFETAGYDRKKLKRHTDFAASGYNTNSVMELDVSDIDGDVDIVSNHEDWFDKRDQILLSEIKPALIES